MKEKDLEAMLIAQKKILDEIDSRDNKEQIVKENTSKERRKRKLSTNEDVPGKLMKPERGDGKRILILYKFGTVNQGFCA